MDFLTGETLYIDKPLKWTSFDVVKCLRSVLSRRMGVKKLKVGHAGTLDPLATGVMVIVTGKSTRLIESLQSGEKEYVATLQLGATTPSYDLEKEIDARYPTNHITRELIDEVLPRFIGTIEQVPPAYSAIKIGGERAYQQARRGDAPELKAKTLTITSLEVVDFNAETMVLTIKVVCSKGTYIRALARDIGEALDSGAHLIALRRTRVGDVDIDDCLSIEQAVELAKTVVITYPEDFNQPNIRKQS